MSILRLNVVHFGLILAHFWTYFGLFWRSWLQESMLFIMFGGFIATGIVLFQRGDIDQSDDLYSIYFAFDPDVFFYLVRIFIISDAEVVIFRLIF